MVDFKELLDEDFGAQSLRQGAVVSGKIVKIDDTGVYVDIGAKTEGNLPLDQLLPSDLPRLQVGDEIKVKVLKQVEGEYILSKRAVDYEEAWNRLAECQKEDEAVTITIDSAAKNGYIARAFGVLEGFVHKSNFDSKPEVGGTYKAYILDMNRRDRKLVFTRRAILEQERTERLSEEFSRFQEGMVVEGTVESLAAYGAFVRISEHITGLLHISEMSWHQVKRPSDVVKKGEKIMVKILDIDPEKKKVSLSLKATQPDPLTTLLPGEELDGKVESIADFGLFVKLENNLVGLVHNSELAYYRFGHPSEVAKVGDKIRVKVLSVDTEARRVALSRKACEQDPWAEIHTKYQLDQVVDVEVTQVLGNGLVVKLDDFFEGFIPIAEISTEHIDHPKRKHSVGDKVQARILNIDTKRKRIRLSIKAVHETEGAAPAPSPGGKTFDTKPTAGKVTLGDIIDTSKLIIEEE